MVVFSTLKGQTFSAKTEYYLKNYWCKTTLKYIKNIISSWLSKCTHRYNL